MPKKLWDILKSLGTGASKKSATVSLHIDDEICFDKFEVANHFNSFFTTIASDLDLMATLACLPNGLQNLKSLTDNYFYRSKGVKSDNFCLLVVDEETVCKIVLGISQGKATDLDDIPASSYRKVYIRSKHL